MKRIVSIFILLGIFTSMISHEWIHALVHDHSEEVSECSLEHQHSRFDQQSMEEVCVGCDHHSLHVAEHHEHLHKYFDECDFLKILSKQQRVLFYQQQDQISFFEQTRIFERIDVLDKVLGNSNSLTNKGPPSLV